MMILYLRRTKKLYLVESLHLLDIVGKVDEPLAPLLQALVLLAKVILKLFEKLFQLGHILCDHGQGQGEEPQNEKVFECHPCGSSIKPEQEKQISSSICRFLHVLLMYWLCKT